VIRERPHDLFRRHGHDILCDVPISFSDAALGTKLDVPTLQGSARVTIPAGTQGGEILRLRGQGLPDLDGGGKGALLIQVTVETPQKLSARQREIFQQLKEVESETAQPARTGFFEKIKSYFQRGDDTRDKDS
jgi:molecular chaperone DnaJ